MVNAVFDSLTDALVEGERIEIRGFGSFIIKHRPAREGRNPRTGTVVSVVAKRVPLFKVGKELRLRVDNQPGPSGHDGEAGRDTQEGGAGGRESASTSVHRTPDGPSNERAEER